MYVKTDAKIEGQFGSDQKIYYMWLTGDHLRSKVDPI